MITRLQFLVRVLEQLILTAILVIPCSAAVFNIASGDVDGLVSAINIANTNGENDVIHLAAGTYTLTTKLDLHTGLPPIKPGTKLAIYGASLDKFGAQTVTIIRNPGNPREPQFRILENGGNLTLDRLRIENGEYKGSGGGIFNWGTLKISNCMITNNRAIESPFKESNGGGLYSESFLYGESVTIVNSTITGNQADGKGGGIYNSFTSLILHRSTVHGNTAANGGGGIYADNPVVFQAINSTISSNMAMTHGGGVLVQSSSELGPTKFDHVTVTMNSAGLNGGGVSVFPFEKFQMKATIIGNNFGPDNTHNDCEGTLVSEGYNLLSANTCDFLSAIGDKTGTPRSPLFPLVDILADYSSGNGVPVAHALLPNSPAIDAVPANKCASLDQRLFVRPEMIRNSPTTCDMGAIEQDAKPSCSGVLSPFRATIVGTAGDDIFPGTDGIDIIHGLGGDDTIHGLGSGDFICGGTGADQLSGLDGNDLLSGQDGDDILNGGAGADILFGGNLEVGNNQLNGDGGNDTIVGGRGDDALDGGRGNDDTCNGGPEITGDTQINCETIKNIP